jgi:hypothetical protein
MPALVTLDYPQPLQTRVINALEADPKSVDLRAQAPHYYALGARMLDLFDDDAMVEVLLTVRLVHLRSFRMLIAAAELPKTSGGDCRSRKQPQRRIGRGTGFPAQSG